MIYSDQDDRETELYIYTIYTSKNVHALQRVKKFMNNHFNDNVCILKSSFFFI